MARDTGVLIRIANALERIADVLEKTPPQPQLWPPYRDGTGDPIQDEFIVTCRSQEGDNG